MSNHAHKHIDKYKSHSSCNAYKQRGMDPLACLSADRHSAAQPSVI